MIRKPAIRSGGSTGWALISQIEHAHLSARLAENWGHPPCLPLQPRNEVLAAIECHDDGWRDWDLAPGVDTESGRPRSFMEMALADSLPIWNSSIDSAARHGPLAAWMVAAHFGALLQGALPRLSDLDASRADAWMEIQERDQQHRMAAWIAANGPAKHRATADRALAHLQLFDRLSLWFCCGQDLSGADSDPRTPNYVCQTPEGGMIEFSRTAGRGVRVAPWPMTVSEVSLELAANLVPDRRYADRDDLASTPREPAQLTWRLQPGPC